MNSLEINRTKSLETSWSFLASTAHCVPENPTLDGDAISIIIYMIALKSGDGKDFTEKFDLV